MAIGSALSPGTRLGRYELVQAVALGGMAEIYLARTQGPQRFEKYVILKRILPHLAAQDAFVEMFLEEARLAASMSHSNIVQVHDFGEVDGSYFFTMEYVHGEDVRSILRTFRKRDARVKIGDALTIVSNVAAGLHYAHELEGPDGLPLGVVHRDVSPSNILVTFDGTVKIADFGIAKATQSEHSTRSGTVKGKVSYMSPEQCEGAPLDRRADVFALAIVLYELTTGRKLFGGDNDLAIMRRIIEKDAPSPLSIVPDYPPALARIVKRALSRDRDARHASALELQKDIEQFCAREGYAVSGPSLAATMTEVFGKRPHPWQGQRQPSTISMDTQGADWDADSRSAQGPSMTSLSAIASEVAIVPPAPVKKRRWGWVAVGFAAAAIAAGVIVMRVNSADEVTPQAAPPPVVVVEEPPPPPPPAPVVEPTIAPPAVEPTIAPPAVEPTLAPVEKVAAPTPKKRRAPVKKPKKPDPKPTQPRDINAPFLPKS